MLEQVKAWFCSWVTASDTSGKFTICKNNFKNKWNVNVIKHLHLFDMRTTVDTETDNISICKVCCTRTVGNLKLTWELVDQEWEFQEEVAP